MDFGFVYQEPDILITLLNMLVHAILLWMPVGVLYVFDSAGLSFRLCVRLALVGSVILFVNISTAAITDIIPVLVLASLAWLILVLHGGKHALRKKKP